MPKKLERCVRKVSRQLKKKKPNAKPETRKSQAYAICSESTGWKVAKGSTKRDKKWVKRKKSKKK